MTKFLKPAAMIFIVTILSFDQMTAQLDRNTTKVGSTVAQFLKIPAGARSIAMGGGAVAMDGDVYSIYYNPGALARMNTPGEATFNHSEWLADMNYNFAAAGLTVEGVGTIGLSVTSLQSPQEIVRTEINPEGDGRQWSYSALSMGLSFARTLTDRFALGMTFKYIREGIWDMSAQGFAVDVGTIYTTSFNGLKIGMSITNFGSKMRLDGYDISFNNFPTGSLGQGPQNIESQYKTEEYDIPLTFRIGMSMDAYRDENIRSTIVVDATHPNDNSEYINSGIEFAFNESVFGRVGYRSLFMNNTEQGLTWGAGVQYAFGGTSSVKVDYAFADYGRLKNVQYVTVSVTY